MIRCEWRDDHRLWRWAGTIVGLAYYAIVMGVR